MGSICELCGVLVVHIDTHVAWHKKNGDIDCPTCQWHQEMTGSFSCTCVSCHP